MDLIRKIRVTTYKIKKYFKNKKYKKQVKAEKAKKYLFKTAPQKTKLELFDIYKSKKKFSNYITSAWLNLNSYKYAYFWVWIFLISMSLYIVMISPYFRISPSKLIIERLDTITDVNIAYKAIEKIYWESIFLIDKEDIRNSLMTYQKNIKKVNVTRLYPNWLKIIIESYKPQFFTQFAWIDKKYIVTSNWVLIYEKNVDKMLYNLEIVDMNLIEAWFFDYKEWVNENAMKKIIYARDLFKDVFTNKNIAKLVYFKLENEIHIFLESGTKIIIELWNNIDKQVAMLKYYNDNNKDVIWSGDVTYIDVRILWKIYVCKERVPCFVNLWKIYPSFYKK
ncbi:MAG: hypothetical protein ACD_2C00107G0003 [uncultured bacterium (gcode 4)]|uniref:POTRA domain-containing protein n=1 Tax=uncultured bacterium (gcode 4) TaxID=1234023 RepID=K2G3F7_9BACT|nr:MAG: hypothetical protein ACD_2C00107G0003 [uncultured bacterium (gcode 4)]